MEGKTIKLQKMSDFLNTGIKKLIISMKNTAVTNIGSDSALHPGRLLTLAA